MPSQLEIIAFNIESCRLAQSAGAHRIELCENPGEGGTTPSFGFIKAARTILSIQLYPIIRPRGGDFLYDETEFDIMRRDVILCRESGCDGVVLGLLRSNGTVDAEKCRQLVDLAYPLEVTFHRAFDRASDPFKALEDIIETGCQRILTSGQKPMAIEGAELIAALVRKAADRVSIMPGSGVRADNIRLIAEKTHAVEFHSSARTFTESKMIYVNKEMKDDSRLVNVNSAEIKAMLTALK